MSLWLFILGLKIISNLGSNVRLTITKPKKYFNTLLLESEDEKEGYILMGRGYIDEYNFKAIKG